MRLDATAAGLDFAPFERWLNGSDRPPVAVAVSGGGDSLALLLTAKLWADRASRDLVALTVDHGLHPDGAAWARFAGERARRLGVAHLTLAWRGEKPATGLPAAARAARHALLARAARTAGARVILLGHTADDVLEAQAMRAAGSPVPTPRVWSPSPAWPEGRGLFLLRPLLGVRRAALRVWLAGRGERWIEDPANEDPRFARARARRQLAGDGDCASSAIGSATRCVALDHVIEGVGGELGLPRAALTDLASDQARRIVAALCLCAAGGGRPPRGPALDRLLARLRSPGAFTAVLAGARIEAGPGQARFCREPGELQRRDVGCSLLPVGESVFDGRFAMIADEPGWSVRPLRGLAKHLPNGERTRLVLLPAPVRAALPVVVRPGRTPSSPVLADNSAVRALALAKERLFAALGGIEDEASMWRVAKSRASS